MANHMEEASYTFPRVPYLKEVLNKVKQLAKADWLATMVFIIKDLFLAIQLMDMEYLKITQQDMKDNFWIMFHMAKV